ncbi:MAG: hypothetical protein WBV78_06305 [Roseobacter sp.]
MLAIAVGLMDQPVEMVVDRSESGMSDAAIEAGVSAFVVNGSQPTRTASTKIRPMPFCVRPLWIRASASPTLLQPL